MGITKNSEISVTSKPDYDRASELKAFDATKDGVKGLVDAGVTKIPHIFYSHDPLDESEKNSASSSNQLGVPSVDLLGIHQDLTRKKVVVEKIREASEIWGFFQVVNHGIPVSVLEEMKNGVLGFYEQDSEVKRGLYSRDPMRPLVYNSNFDLFSSPAANWRDTFYCFMAPHPPKPEDLPSVCRDIMLEYTKQVMKLGSVLFELLSEALGLNPNHLNDMGCNEGLAVACHYYPSCPEPELTLGTTKHTDNDFITVLLQDHIGGLQVLHENKWVDVSPVPGALVINIGDLLQKVEMDKPRNVKQRGTSRFSNANKRRRRRHVNQLFVVFGANIQFSEKSKKGEKVRSLSAVSTSLSQMGCCHVSEKQAHEPAKRFKIPNNFLNDCNGVYHASVPRKLRSAMKKRSRESNLLDSEKKQGISQNCSPREGVSVSGSITKDEEEVAQTLYALAEMFPHSGSNHISREPVGESLPENSSVLQDLEENANASLEASATGQGGNPCPEEASKITCINETTTPTINLQTIPGMVKPENCNKVSLHDSELCLAMRQSQISHNERKPDVKSEAARDVDSKPKQHIEKEGLALWPGLSSVASAGQAFQQSFATEAPDWLEATTCASKQDLMETSTCSSSGKICEVVIHKRSWKRCAAHVHITHIIRSLEAPKKGVIKQSELHECHEMRAHEGSKPGVLLGVHNLNRMRNGVTCATVRKPCESKNGILQQQMKCHYRDISQAAPTPGVYGPQKQSFNFLSLSTGSYGVKVDNNHSNIGNRLEPLSKLQVPYFQSLAQQQRVMPIPTTLYLDQLTVVGPQLRLQQPHYYSSTVTNKQEHQNFCGVQQVAQGRSSVNCNIIRTQHPNWQNGRHDSSAMIPCAQAIFPHSPASQEIFGSKITSISGQQHHLIPDIQDNWARSSPFYM